MLRVKVLKIMKNYQPKNKDKMLESLSKIRVRQYRTKMEKAVEMTLMYIVIAIELIICKIIIILKLT